VRLSKIFCFAMLTSSGFAGFPFSYGVFQAYYSRTEPFAGSNQLSAVGALSSVGNPAHGRCKLVAECSELQLKGNSISSITALIPNNQ